MAAGNAYVLAEVEKGEFRERERKRINTINGARKKAVSHYNGYFGEKKKEEEEDKEEAVTSKGYTGQIFEETSAETRGGG